jgi:Tol biopolymer transport system component
MGRSASRPAWAVAALLAVLCSTAFAFVADTKIAFVSWRDGDSEIYTMNSDGSGLTQLTDNVAADEFWPSWSPDGSEIVFSSTRNGEYYDIYIMDAAGQNVRQLTQDAGDNWEPAWSPDGSRIAFISYRTGLGELYVMDVDGFEAIQLSFSPDAQDATYENFGPTWSPDSTQIAYQSVRDDNSDIYVVDADSGIEYQLTTDFGWDFWPAWSPDGANIAFGSWRDGDPEIYTVPPEFGAVTRLTESSGYDGRAMWSPDGIMIAFETDRDAIDGNGDTNIYVMFSDGADPTPLTDHSARDESPAWSPAMAGDVLIYVVGGTALDDSGEPVAGLDVVVNNVSRPELVTSGVTDVSGVFTVSLFDAFASVVMAGDTITVEAYDGEFLVGATELVLSETDIDAGVTTVTLDVRPPVQIVLNGVGFDALPLVAFTEQAAAAAVSGTDLPIGDQAILATALETTLLQLVLPGYPNSTAVLYPDFGNALVADNLGNPMTFPREYLVTDIGNIAGDVPRVLGAPLLNVLATTDADVAGVTMSLNGRSGGADALVLRVASGTLAPYTFVFDSAAALNFLAAWAGGLGVPGSLPAVEAVSVIVEERDASSGVVLNTLSAPLVAIDGNTWATASPTSLTPGRVVQYVYEVTLAGDVELADGTLVSSWVLPDPYNFQWVDVADGASAIARISQIGRNYSAMGAAGMKGFPSKAS